MRELERSLIMLVFCAKASSWLRGYFQYPVTGFSQLHSYRVMSIIR